MANGIPRSKALRTSMEINKIKTINLENGLNLEFYDSSKKIAGDRWQVKLTVRVEISVSDYSQDFDDGIDRNDVMKVLGLKVVYEKNMERNFIDDKEKETVLNGFCDSFLESALSYLSAINFPKQFIIKKYREKKSREKYY